MIKDLQSTKLLVQEKITILRKWWHAAYLHSWWVWDKLQYYLFQKDVILAWLLHDIVEDSDMTFEELKKLGYSDTTLNIVLYVTHDELITDRDEKRNKMMMKCIEQESKDIWAVKIADFRDNITDFKWVSSLFIEMMLFKRWPLFVYFGNKYFSWTKFYNDFMDEYRNQVCSFQNSFITQR